MNPYMLVSFSGLSFDLYVNMDKQISKKKINNSSLRIIKTFVVRHFKFEKNFCLTGKVLDVCVFAGLCKNQVL